ncbi:MAG: glutamate racemase [Myxococcales bacterium]|nr:glutamate racemase [Myxococcales bacterium]
MFDSGVGGLTVLGAMWTALPHHDTIYLGDTARVPYGTKSAGIVTRYAVEIADFLVRQGIELLVVACNTASSVALPELRKRFDVPVVGVVEPGVRGALRETRSGRIGVIGTEGTVRSDAYGKSLAAGRPDVHVRSVACPLFVPLAEQHWLDGEIAHAIAARYLAPLKEARVDTLILGCTHYPLLKGVIHDVMGPDVRLIDSATETAEEVSSLVGGPGTPRRPTRRLFTTDLPERFVRVGTNFLGEDISHTELVTF